MATLDELRLQIYRILGAPDGAGYSNELVIDAINMAFDAILPWAPKTLTTTLDGDGAALTYALPAHTYEVEAVVDSDGEVLPRSFLLPGQHIGERTEAINDWLEYPEGSLTFSKAIASGYSYTVYYLAHWTKPTTSSEKTMVLEPPERTFIGIALYAAAYCLLPAAVGASEVRQFNTRIDSGTPEQNPMQKTMLYLLDLFQREMSRHPKHQKAVK